MSQKKAETLLTYVAYHRQPSARQTLAHLFWGDYPENRALNNLSVLLSNIKKRLGDTLVVSRQTVYLNTAAVWIDAQVFSEGINKTNGSAVTDAQLGELSEVLALYKGDFLAGVVFAGAPYFEHWADTQRVYLRQRALNGFSTLLKSRYEQARYAEGIELARKVLELDDLHKHANYRLMEMLALNDRRSEAVTQFAAYEEHLKAFGLEPEADIRELMDQIRRGGLKAEKRPVSPPRLPSATRPASYRGQRAGKAVADSSP